MQQLLLTILLLFMSMTVSANDLGVSISVGQPGFYGQITLGNHYPSPQVIYQNPRVAMPPAYPMQQQPIYLHVPPGHAKKWSKHCHQYNACHLPVYFVRESWYNNVYVPQYANQYRHDPYRQGDHYDHNGRHDRYDDHDDRQGYGKGAHRDRDDHDGRGKGGHGRGNRRD